MLIFPEEALRDVHSIYGVLQNFGRDRPDDLDVESAHSLLSTNDEFEIAFTFTFIQKFLAALRFDCDTHAITRLSDYHPDIDLAELEPLLWDDFTGNSLIMYTRKTKVFGVIVSMRE